MNLVRTVEPIGEVLTLKEVRDFLRVEHSDENNLLASMIMGATSKVEKYLSRSLLTQTWVLSIDDYPADTTIPLYYGTVQSITSVTSYLSDGTTDVFDNTNYYLVNAQLKPEISLVYNALWPSNILRPKEGVKIEYITGYGDDASDVPYSVKEAILHIIASMYENRETGTIISSTVKSLLSDQMVYTL